MADSIIVVPNQSFVVPAGRFVLSIPVQAPFGRCWHIGGLAVSWASVTSSTGGCGSGAVQLQLRSLTNTRGVLLNIAGSWVRIVRRGTAG